MCTAPRVAEVAVILNVQIRATYGNNVREVLSQCACKVNYCNAPILYL
jgi:hypothetical protein